jgi:4-aminobutyrate aminotransferase-like enzyme
MCVDGAYHGNGISTIAVSPYKFAGPGGNGQESHVHVAKAPDTYRGKYNRRNVPEHKHNDIGRMYGQDVAAQIASMEEPLGTFICESVLGCAGQIVLPDGYLKHVFDVVRKQGGVCIADEVQVGFGRVGSHFWGFETQDVVPDIVTMGKRK